MEKISATTKQNVKFKNKEYELEAKDAAMLEAIKELIRVLKIKNG